MAKARKAPRRSKAARRPRASVVGIIPARLGSTRFPGKVLADETGHPLIWHVWQAARRANALDQLVVATDDQHVLEVVRGFGAEAVLTRADHPNGTSRLAEAATLLRLGPSDIVVNVQGDEPELEPSLIDAAVAALRRAKADMATCAVPFAEEEDPSDPNVVKVVLGLNGSALYFSRSLVPFVRDPAGSGAATPLRHIGLYVYRRPFLRKYAALAPTPLEKLESLEQLRALEHGHAIAVAVRTIRTFGGVDTPEQYRAFVRRWRERTRPPRAGTM